MTNIRAGLLLLALPLLMAAAPPKPVVKAAPAKPVVKSQPLKAASKPAPAPPVQNADVAKTYPLQSLAFPGGVTMTEMVYSTPKGFRPLTLDLYQTTTKAFPRPALVFVHGGAWNSGDSRHAGTFGDFPGLLASLAARGFVVVSVNYRLSGEARFPAALEDVKTAISWLRGHASDFNIDDTRIAIWGASEGGQLAALAGVSCGVAALEPPSDNHIKLPSDCVEAVIDWYGVTDFATLHDDLGTPAPDKSDEGDYLGCEPALCPLETAHNASPLTYIEAMSPPFLIQHGADDAQVSSKQSQKLYDALHDKGVPAELVIYPGVGHDFAKTGQKDGTPDPATNKQAVEKLEAFLDATFPKKAPPGPAAKTSAKSKALPY